MFNLNLSGRLTVILCICMRQVQVKSQSLMIVRNVCTSVRSLVNACQGQLVKSNIYLCTVVLNFNYINFNYLGLPKKVLIIILQQRYLFLPRWLAITVGPRALNKLVLLVLMYLRNLLDSAQSGLYILCVQYAKTQLSLVSLGLFSGEWSAHALVLCMLLLAVLLRKDGRVVCPACLLRKIS